MRNRVGVGRWLLLAGLFVVGTAYAQDNLYGPSAPPDAAYVRIVNAVPGGEAAVRFADADYLVGFATVTPYRVVEPGDLTLNVAGTEQPLTAEAGEFYTVVLTPEGVNVLNDEALVDASRALLTLYNFSSLGPLDLKTADGETSIVTSVAPGGEGSIVVNQAEVGLGVFDGSELVGETEPSLLERGTAYSVLVFDGEIGPVVVLEPAALE